jgi:uncharacterized membrane protein YcaP (DUF421 family)
MAIDWQTLLVPKVSVVELFIRGSVIYLSLFAVLRVLVRRHVGTMSLMDLLLIVLIADAAQNAMSSEYRSLPEGLILCGTIIGWSYTLDWLAFQFPALRPLLEPTALPLIQNGRFQRRNMRQELITMEELMSHLRQHGIEDVHEVKRAYIEPDGQISIIKADSSGDDESPNKGSGRAL